MIKHQRPLERALGHRFHKAELLDKALTHRSASADSNERLEYLGDAVLGVIISEALFTRFPEADEGELSRLRSALVKGKTLAKLARKLELGEHLKLGAGEIRSGGRQRDSILAGAFEALVAAVYFDAGIETCRHCVLELYRELLAAVSPAGLAKDAKTALQEWLQARGMALPRYELVSEEGQAHRRSFQVECAIDALGLAVRAQGQSKRMAQQGAAANALSMLAGEAGSGAREPAGAARDDGDVA